LYCFLLVTSPWRLERRRGRILGEKGEEESGKEMLEERRGERRKKQATFVRSGRGPGDHVHFF
jgi:hypothetical protein